MIRAAGLLWVAAVLIVGVVLPGPKAAEKNSPIHHEADVRLDPETRRLTISDVISINGRSELRLRLASWLKIESLHLDRQPIPLQTLNSTGRIVLPSLERHQISINLQGIIPAQQTARGNGTAQGAASGPDGGFLFERAGWIPDTGDEWISYGIKVEVPAAYRAVATGRLGNENIGTGKYRANFTGTYPAAPPSLFVGPYDVRERLHDNIRIRTYFHRDLTPQTDNYLSDSARYLTRYVNEIGPYPYDDFHVISAPIQVGLGFPNLTYIGRRIIPLPFIRARSLAHEVLHNWWGNGITVDYRKGNWAEGLTTYMADYALAAEKDTRRGQQMRLGWLRDYAALPTARDIPVTQFTAKHDDAAQVVGYNKVAFIFHMLKQELGEPKFSAALKLFWRQRQNQMASWEDLRQAFESESARDLMWFFKQWLTKAGAPRLHLEQVKLTAPSDDGKYQLGFTVRQDPPTYRLSVPIVIETETGPHHTQIKAEGVNTAATLETDTRPIALHIDRSYDLFRRLSRGEAPFILRDVTLANKVVTVIAAKDKAMYGIARNLAGRLLDTRMQMRPTTAPELLHAPYLVMGSSQEIKAFLARYRLAGIPETLRGRGTSRVWTAYGAGDNPILVVEADDAEALQALLRPLPHYGRRSYLIFNGRRAIDKGIWPAKNSPLSHRFN